MVGHRLKGLALLHTGEIAGGRAHLDRTIALYDPATHRPLAPRFGQDIRVAALAYRSWALWLLGYPVASLEDAAEALKDAREIGHTASLMYAGNTAAFIDILCGELAAANALIDETVALANEKGILFLSLFALGYQGMALAAAGDCANAVQKISSSIPAYRAMGSNLNMPLRLMFLARAHADLGHLDDAWRCIGEAMTTMETTKETWMKAEVHRVAGEVALKSRGRDAAKAQACFDSALTVARQQQAKSWELRAAMSMARLWRDQGKRDEARELLAPVYGWFTEGFDTRDLKEAKTLLDELAS
jgi:predicted ATPase